MTKASNSNVSSNFYNRIFFQTGWVWLSFASGFAALIYQVLWMKQMSAIYGATARSVSITLVAFFLGLSVGSYVWGK